MPMRTFSARCAALATTLLALAGLTPLELRAQEGSMEAMESSISQADKSLRDGNSAGAEAAYRQGILEGWLLLGTLERLEGHPEQAREAFLKASKEAGGERRGAFAAAQLLIQQDELEEARKTLEKLLREEPGDLEAAFALGRVELGEKKPAAAEALFDRLQRERPIPQTHLIVGRTWRDFGDFARARASFHAALALDAAAPHAHYELGLTALRGEGRAGLEAAIPEFQAELARDPADTRAALELGVALVEVQRAEEAIAPLRLARDAAPQDPRAVAYLGRALYASGQAEEGVAFLRQALEYGAQRGANPAALRAMHLHLGQALRAAGRGDEAASEFRAAEALSEQNTAAERDQMARYMADTSAPAGGKAKAVPFLELSPLASLPPAERKALRDRTASTLARVFLNLAVLEARRGELAGALGLLAQAEGLDATLPELLPTQAALYFDAGLYAKAIPPLERALAATPGDASLRRRLALAKLGTHDFAAAAELLRDDPQRPGDRALQTAYASALIKSGRSAEAEPVLDALQAEGRSAEVSVLVGQSYAQQGHYASAIAALEDALAQKADAAEANATLGLIYLKQGRTAEAIAQLETASRLAPEDASLHYQLAQAYGRSGRDQDAERHMALFRKLTGG